MLPKETSVQNILLHRSTFLSKSHKAELNVFNHSLKYTQQMCQLCSESTMPTISSLSSQSKMVILNTGPWVLDYPAGGNHLAKIYSIKSLSYICVNEQNSGGKKQDKQHLWREMNRSILVRDLSSGCFGPKKCFDQKYDLSISLHTIFWISSSLKSCTIIANIPCKPYNLKFWSVTT